MSGTPQHQPGKVSVPLHTCGTCGMYLWACPHGPNALRHPICQPGTPENIKAQAEYAGKRWPEQRQAWDNGPEQFPYVEEKKA